MKKIAKYSLVVACVLTLAATAHAQGTPPAPGVVDQVLKNFINASTSWQGHIVMWANRLFYLLVTIDVVWMGITMAFKEGGGIQTFFAELIRRVFFIGFYLALLQYGNTWGNAIIASFQQIGAGAISDAALGNSSGDLPVYDSLSPSSIGIIGIKYADLIFATFGASSILNPGSAVIFGMIGLLVVVGFGMIMIRMVVVLAEAYVVLSAGVIVLGFGGSKWTKDYATNYLRYAVSIGIKLFFIQLSVALAVSFINSLYFQATSIEAGLSLLLALGVGVVLVFMLPTAAADLVRGHSNSTGNEGFAVGAAATATALTMVAKMVSIMAPPAAPAAAAAAAAAKAAAGATTRAPGSGSGGAGGNAATKGLSGGMSKPAGAATKGGVGVPPIVT